MYLIMSFEGSTYKYILTGLDVVSRQKVARASKNKRNNIKKG